MKYAFILFGIFVTSISFAQNVGIGTTVPDYTLHVKSTVGEAAMGINAAGTVSQSLLNLSIDNRADGNGLALIKYRPGVTGTTSGLPKSNLSVISADAGAGPLLLSTNQNSPLYFATNSQERLRILGNGHVGINTTDTQFGWLNVESNDNNAAAIYSLNNITTGVSYGIASRIASPEGAGLSGVASDNNQASSIFENIRYGVLGTVGNIGVGVGAYGFGASSAIRGYNIDATGFALRTTGRVRFDGIGEGLNKVLTSDANGTGSWQNLPAGATAWTTSGSNIFKSNPGNVGVGVMPTPFVKFHVVRPDNASAAPTGNLGAIYGENGSTTDGSGVVGVTFAARSGVIGNAGVSGNNLGSATDLFGVIGQSSGTSGGGIYSAGVGGYGDNGVLGYSQSNTGAGVLAQHSSGKTALELNNGYIKVSGANKTAFVHTVTAGNTSAHITYLSYANPASSDIVIAVPNFNPNGVGGVYNNRQIGVYWDFGTWSIFNQDQVNMPIGASFNVIVIKQ